MGSGPGIELDFVPLWVAQVWRVLLWALMLFLIALWSGTIADYLRGRRPFPTWVALGQLALLVYTARSAFAQAIRWNAPVLLEGLPMTTLAVLIALAGVLFRAREQKRMVR